MLRLSSAQSSPGIVECQIDPSSSDNECPLNSDGSFGDFVDSEIECSEDYSCCYCDDIECPDCVKFQIDGDYGAYGVTPIVIVGDDEDGIKIECSG